MKRLLRCVHANHQFIRPTFANAIVNQGLMRHSIWAEIKPTSENITSYMEHFMSFARWPLPNVADTHTFSEDHPGNFGAARKHDIHTGVDLYCDSGDSVLAIEDAVVVGIENFTGPDAEDPSPWWNNTKAILAEGRSGVIVYGEVEPDPFLKVGSLINAGLKIGTVVPVLKEDKGRPMSMLHVELYLPGTRKTVWWRHGEPKPRDLLDPTELLRRASK